MLGYNSGTNDRRPISDDELLAIARFMEAGGGVYATGDHDSVGSDMAGRIPRAFPPLPPLSPCRMNRY